MRAGRRRIWVMLAVGISAPSCVTDASPSPPAASPTHLVITLQPTLYPDFPHNFLIWDEPYGSRGVHVDSVVGAQALVHFEIHEPQAFSEPRISVLSNVQGVEGFAFAYDWTPYSMVWVNEQSPQDWASDEERFDAWETAVANGSPRAEIRLVTIRGGITAFLISSGDPSAIPTRLEWVEDGVQFQVSGPRLSAGDAIEIANKI